MKIFLFTALLIPLVSQSGTLDDFFKQHPELYKNVYTRNAIKSEASVATLNDVMIQKKPGEMSGEVMRRLLNEDGDSYAKIALRSLEQKCNAGVAMESSQLKPEDCELIVSNSN